MLHSQRPHNIRNIRSTVGQPVQVAHTKPGPMELLGELAIHDLMAADAKACKARMQGGGGWSYLDNKQAAIRGKQQGTKDAILAYLDRVGGWRGRREICAALRISGDAAANALYALSTKGRIEKRIVSRGKFSAGNIGQWRTKGAGNE
jgi:hypothetical protein